MNEERHNISARVPEGYFDDLRTRLQAIPQEYSGTSRNISGRWGRIAPYAALAACFALMVAVGTAVLKHTVPESAISEEEELFYAGLAHTSQGNLEYDLEEYADPVSDDDIINYLIESAESEDIYICLNEQ